MVGQKELLGSLQIQMESNHMEHILCWVVWVLYVSLKSNGEEYGGEASERQVANKSKVDIVLDMTGHKIE